MHADLLSGEVLGEKLHRVLQDLAVARRLVGEQRQQRQQQSSRGGGLRQAFNSASQRLQVSVQRVEKKADDDGREAVMTHGPDGESLSALVQMLADAGEGR